MLSRPDQGALRQAARKRAKDFDLLVQGNAMVEVYQKAIEAHKARSRVLILGEKHKTRWEELLSIFRL